MAVAKMKLVSIIGNLKKLDDVVSAACASGCFQPESAMNIYGNISGFSAMNEENPYTTSLNRLSDIMRASGIKSNAGLGEPDVKRDEIRGFMSVLTSNVGSMQEQRGELLRQIGDIGSAIEQFSHFLELDISLSEIFGSKFIKVRFGRLPVESYEKLGHYSDNPYVMFFLSSKEEHSCWGMYMAPADKVIEVDRIFASLYFERMRIPDAAGTPACAIKELTVRKERTMAELDSLIKRLDEFWKKEKDVCIKVYNMLKRLTAEFDIRRNAAKYGNKFVFTGFVPSKSLVSFLERIDKIEGVEAEFDAPGGNQNRVKIPTELRNVRFFRPFEMYVNMFGTPGYNEVDPTVLVGITYILFFGIMFADLGQGLIVTLAGWLAYKIKGMEIGRILIRCGISSMLFGTALGSVFGFEETLNPLFNALGMEEKPFNVMHMDTLSQLIMPAVGMGALLILCAMLINVYARFKSRDIKSALFGHNGIMGLLFYGSLVTGITLMALTGKNVFSLYYILGLMVIPLIAMFLKEPLSRLLKGEKNPFKLKWGDYIIENLSEMFDHIISYATNTLSFMRVGIFVVVHAAMMVVVFGIAEMFGPVGFVISVIIGNVVVIVMEGLIAGIQALRLEFYEIFSRFFEGDGRKFSPVSLDNTQKENNI